MRRAEDRGKGSPFELRANGAAPSAQSMADALVLVPLSAPACLPLFSPHTLCGPLLFVPCVLCCLLWPVLDDTCTPEPPPPDNACSNPRTSSNMYQLTSRRLCRWYWVQSVRGKCSRVLAVRMAASRPAALIHLPLCGNDYHARASTDSVRIHSRPLSPTGACVCWPCPRISVWTALRATKWRGKRTRRYRDTRMSQGAALDPDYVTSGSEVEYCLYVWDAHHDGPCGHHAVSLSSSNCDDVTVVRRLLALSCNSSIALLPRLLCPNPCRFVRMLPALCLYILTLASPLRSSNSASATSQLWMRCVLSSGK